MTLSDLQSLIGSLTNDPAHDRYALTDINTELDNTQDKWNLEAKIIKDTYTVALVSGTRRYALTGLTGTPISFPRATFDGLDIDKRGKTWLDLYSGSDWTQESGTIEAFIIEAEDPDNQFITFWRTPDGDAASKTTVVEYVKRHTPMSSSTDTPFMSVTTANYLLRPYDWGIAYDAAARLITRDPTKENAKKQVDYQNIANGVLAEVIQVFKALEKEEPLRLRGGRYWKSGNLSSVTQK